MLPPDGPEGVFPKWCGGGRGSRVVVLLVSIVALLSDPGPRRLHGQGVTTASIRGTVHDPDGSRTADARVSAVNAATGFRVEGTVIQGRFLLQGLETGGPYVVTIAGPGRETEMRRGIFLRLGEQAELHFELRSAAVLLDTLRARVVPDANRQGGIGTIIPDSLLHRLPTLNRDFYDLARLVPHVSTKVGMPPGMSGGGVGARFNSYLINGVSERTTFANATAALAGGKSLPLEAVREYQVLIAPYDARYGDFAGALVNTVTRSGTNRLAGSLFAYARTDRLGRRAGASAGSPTPASPYEKVQFGFTAGGPIIRDRLHFFFAPELQHFRARAEGPYLGQPDGAGSGPVPVSAGEVTRLNEILAGHGLRAGSGGMVQNRNPLANVFARADYALPSWGSRIVAWTSYGRSADDRFSRIGRDTFPLSAHGMTLKSRVHLTAVHLHTTLPRRWGGHNELQLSYDTRRGDNVPAVRQPIVQVAVPGTGGSGATILTGTPPIAQGSESRLRTISVSDQLALPVRAGLVVNLGASAEHFRIERTGVPGSYGTWTFASLDALASGTPARYELRQDLGSASAPLSGVQYGAYAGSEWHAGARVAVSLGVRADLLTLHYRAPYNPIVDSVFGRRTDALPRRQVHISPRLGVRWDVTGTGRAELRGGVGIFTGRPPLAWYQAALASYGLGVGVLQCGFLPTDRGPPPMFVADHRAAPTSCANGAGIAAGARDVDLLARDLDLARTLRSSIGYELQLSRGVAASLEALVTRNLSDLVFANLNLAGPQGQDRNGRVLYGEIRPAGVALPTLRAREFAEVIDLRNTARNRSHQVAARIEKRFADGTALTASYTYARVRDVQTPLRNGVRGIVNWSSRAVSGSHEDLRLETSLNDVPHRVILVGTHRMPWRRWTTDFAFYYVGEAGSPFTYRAWGTERRGDLNADGSNANDPIYVPRDVRNPAEIRFSGELAAGDNSPEAQAARIRGQQDAFERLILGTECLRRQRGRIVARNSCREPWSHTTIASVRQALPIADRPIELELQLFNVLNLLNREWGRYRLAVPEILEHTAQIVGNSPEEGQAVFRFDANAPQWEPLQAESAFQLQLGLRFRF